MKHSLVCFSSSSEQNDALFRYPDPVSGILKFSKGYRYQIVSKPICVGLYLDFLTILCIISHRINFPFLFLCQNTQYDVTNDGTMKKCDV